MNNQLKMQTVMKPPKQVIIPPKQVIIQSKQNAKSFRITSEYSEELYAHKKHKYQIPPKLVMTQRYIRASGEYD